MKFKVDLTQPVIKPKPKYKTGAQSRKETTYNTPNFSKHGSTGEEILENPALSKVDVGVDLQKTFMQQPYQNSIYHENKNQSKPKQL